MSNNLVAYSRAGDVFHYRWAARRCLRLIYPNSSTKEIYIEGSKERNKAGEYVIDVSEYSVDNEGTEKKEYYQLKHTTVQHDKPFTLSNLKETFEGFAKRYLYHKKQNEYEILNISFTIITNRKISDSFKENLAGIVNEDQVDDKFKKTIKKYTGLTSSDLISFCGLIKLEDGEGNYSIQKTELRIEMAQLVAGAIENAQIENLVALVQEKVLPESDHKIIREEVLKRFGITSERDLYPAPAMWKEPKYMVERYEYTNLKNNINNSSCSVIVHAAGGVGKSVFCFQLINSLSEGSLGIAFDCFGSGSYRNRSETRHRHRDGLVQIVNELASMGLCDPLIVQNTTLDEDIMRKFILRLKTSITSLKKTTDSAQLFILVDAADNAEMAAKEYAQPCFAHELLREEMPEGCKLVLLCRTERISLLQPQSHVTKLELQPFTKEETLEHLRKFFPLASNNDADEFYRLTSGNPRVQANALDVKHQSLENLLTSLGPYGTTVEKQIEFQLDKSILKIEDHLPREHHKHIHSICMGLACLPPNIPIEVLSKVSNVSIDHIKSFVSDIGRSLWLSDTSIQFRDEPTETWFRNKFVAEKENYQEFISILEPHAQQLTYVAEVLPQLYLQAGQYDKLINMALSNDLLPFDNPIDARNIRIYRLQFAFKAALEIKNLNDSVKLAMRAGEEVAGNVRQLTLFRSNIDLLTILQNKEKVQEIAFKRLISSGWDGSENIYSASLLSGIEDYHGESRGYLRAAMNWLGLYFEEQRKFEDRHRNLLQDDDLLELAYSHLNIYGIKSCSDFLFRLNPKEAIFRIVQKLIKRLIDIGRFVEINKLLSNFTIEPYYMVAGVSELIQVGKFPPKKDIEKCLSLLCLPRQRIKKPENLYNDHVTPAIISFLEVCLYRNLSKKRILQVLEHYVPVKAARWIYNSHSSNERTIYLKALSIKAVLSNESEVNVEAISKEVFASEEKSYKLDKEIKEFREVINGLFPWYLLRAQILYNKDVRLLDAVGIAKESSQRALVNRSYQSYDTLPKEIAQVCASVIIFYQQANEEEITVFFQKVNQSDNAFSLKDKLNILRAAHRLTHLNSVKNKLELSARELIKSYHVDGPEDLANQYIELARAILMTSQADASVYFDEAVKVVSNFGEEIVQRWEAVVSLAKIACEKETVSDELAYRFIRCAELVGENVYREKNWNRNEAVCMCIRMSTGIGISSLSRWRDRNIGRFDYQFEAALKELVNSKKISSSIGWSMTRFFSDHIKIKLLSICIENEPSLDIQQNIIKDAVDLLRKEGANGDDWSELMNIATKHKIENQELVSVITFYSKKNNYKPMPIAVQGETRFVLAPEPKLDELFEGLKISTIDDFAKLMKRFNSNSEMEDFNFHIDDLLKEAINRLDEKSFWDFFDVILYSESISLFQIESMFTSLPQSWLNKVNFEAKLPKAVYKVGQRYAHKLTNEYRLNSFLRAVRGEQSLKEHLTSGVISGLANGMEVSDANVFFDFVKMISTSIENSDAIELLNYSLKRFEIHIDEDFGDGPWNESLYVKDDIDVNIAGLIWSALGDPKSEVRWNAAHCIRKLAEFNCTRLFDALVDWMKLDKVDAFGYYKFPFYKLHARQYLLIAFARISIENSKILHKFSDQFFFYASTEQHVLIQKFARDIILRIEKKFPGTYSQNDLASIPNVEKSSMPIQEVEYNYTTKSYWHIHAKIDTSVKFHFGWDFDRYWYEPLGDVFGIPGKEVEELAANVIVNEWKEGAINGYKDDPRVIIWDRSSASRETWHDHGSYPRTDSLDFYLSYHAMLVVAAKLFEKMPIIKENNWYEDPWTYWLSRHLLTRQDGKWLSDARDALPLDRPTWISLDKNSTWQNDTWQTEVKEEDYISCMKIIENDELWLGIKGYWHEKKSERTETFSITTALVSPETSDSLLRALGSCNNPYDYKLPSYMEDRKEIESGKFKLKGWIYRADIDKGIDEYDPYAFGLSYPPYSLGDDVMEKLELTVGQEGKAWRFLNSHESILTCEIWNSQRQWRDEESDQSGIRLRAKLSFLKFLCSKLDFDLIFDVSIRREITHTYDKDNSKYTKPINKIFILSADGKLRTTRTNYQLG